MNIAISKEVRLKPVLSISHLSVKFTGGDGSPVLAVDDVSLSLATGEILCIVGPSGCGKSTVLNVVAGMVRSTPSAPVEISGDFHIATQATLRSRQIGYMFQQDTLLPWKTALQNVMLPLTLQGRPGARERAEELLALTGLEGFGGRFPKELSGGMRKRVQMAQLLAQDPEILLMDEPFGALDAQTRALMQQEFLRVWERDRKSIVFVTHDLTEAILLGDRILSMSARPGRIKREVSVGIARPRTVESLVGSDRYAELHHMLWADLQAEAVRTLGGGVR
ncbi:MAG TPA: ABC transporter ATP-binding protein [Rhizobiaceae bacterium]|nr:ABC transporter ATP-binding protein [Rhizobiaceae bacterium]